MTVCVPRSQSICPSAYTDTMVTFVGSAIPGDRDGFKMEYYFLFNFKRSACRIVKLKDKEENELGAPRLIESGTEVCAPFATAGLSPCPHVLCCPQLVTLRCFTLPRKRKPAVSLVKSLNFWT